MIEVWEVFQLRWKEVGEGRRGGEGALHSCIRRVKLAKGFRQMTFPPKERAGIIWLLVGGVTAYRPAPI